MVSFKVTKKFFVVLRKGSKVRKVYIATHETRQEVTNIQTRLLLTSVESGQ